MRKLRRLRKSRKSSKTQSDVQMSSIFRLLEQNAISCNFLSFVTSFFHFFETVFWFYLVYNFLLFFCCNFSISSNSLWKWNEKDSRTKGSGAEFQESCDLLHDMKILKVAAKEAKNLTIFGQKFFVYFNLFNVCCHNGWMYFLLCSNTEQSFKTDCHKS